MLTYSFDVRRGIYFVTFLLGSINAQFNNECRTPKDQNGICIDIDDCQELRTLLEFQKHEESVLTLLKKSICGFKGKIPKVCCPTENSFPSKPAPRRKMESTEVNGADSSTKLPPQTMCGRTNVSRIRIFGGTPSELGAWPWIAALGYQNFNRDNNEPWWLCGGSLITNSHVLTAAHCVTNLEYLRVTVARLGELNLDPDVNDGASPLDVPIDRTIVHDGYNSREITNDVALLKLKRSVTYTQFIQPICLPISSIMKDINLERVMPFVAGWGSTRSTSTFSEPATTTLMEVQVPMTNTEECRKTYANNKNVIDDRVLCAGYPEGGKDSCRGDSGGPLMWPRKNRYYLIGIVSYGFKKCGEPGYPGVYTNVSFFIDWIVENVNNNYV